MISDCATVKALGVAQVLTQLLVVVFSLFTTFGHAE